jgi:phosphoribosylaminoimidazolecarboxamide formyltransferase/IMP cyclohydrolase
LKKRALISVYNKEGLLELAKCFTDNDIEIISTGGTSRYLRQNGIEVVDIEKVTGFPEILDGRVKTLHPKIHAGILAIRDNPIHTVTLEANTIRTIDFVVVNLYPFFEKINDDLSFEEKIEFIDIGGPTMLRSAAKNFKDVVVICQSQDYPILIEHLNNNEPIDYLLKKKWASKVFNLTSAYDAAVCDFLNDEDFPEYLSLSYKKQNDLRYGENPHQKACFYVSTYQRHPMNTFRQLHGKELSYNNIKDIDIAWKAVSEFEKIACCAVKHNSPCGCALGETVLDAFVKTYDCDPISIFGGILAFNSIVDVRTAQEIHRLFVEAVIAPGYEEEALHILTQKKNIRIIENTVKPSHEKEWLSVDGGVLVQSCDTILSAELQYVTNKKPDDMDIEELLFGMKVVKYVKSNAIVVCKDFMAKGIGCGQVNRIWAARQALERAGLKQAYLASDAFFPFSDIVAEAAKYDVKSIIQPGGSINDKDSIKLCNDLGISMVFTKIRHFKH